MSNAGQEFSSQYSSDSPESESKSESESEPDHDAASASWWRRPCGGAEVMHVALPLMISTLSYSLMQFCDRVFLAWSSVDALAAVLPAGVIAFTILSFPFGLAMYTNVFVAQYFGADQKQRIGSVMAHGLLLGCMFLPIFILNVLFPGWVFSLSGHSTEMISQESDYFRYISVGSIAHTLSAVLTTFFIGQGRTRLVMSCDIFVASLNVLLDWLLIFGLTIGGDVLIPAMGIRGAAIATSIALWVKFLLFAALVYGPKQHRTEFALTKPFRYDGDLIGRMFRFGSSNGLQYLLECGGFAVFVMMIAKIGELQSAATTVAISVNMMVFVPIFGLSTAVSTLVGQQIGDANPKLAERATWTSMQIGLAYTGVLGSLYLFAPDLFLFGHEVAAENFEEISRLARLLLYFIAAYCLFDTIQLVLVGAIKGAGDTFFVVVASVICSGVFVAAGTAGGLLVTSENGLMYWWWSALTGWLVLLSLVYWLRFRQGKWKTMTVMEKTLID